MPCRRSNCVLRLALIDLVKVEVMPTAVTATVLGSQCSSLLELELRAPNVGMAGPKIAALAALTRLTRLDVRTNLLASCQILLCVTCLARLRHSNPASPQAFVRYMLRLAFQACMRGRRCAKSLHRFLASGVCADGSSCLAGIPVWYSASGCQLLTN